jgi:hypothetical protein
MTTLALPLCRRPELRPFDDVEDAPDSVLNQQRLLVWSDDEQFYRRLYAAASQVGRKLLRKRATDDPKRTLRFVKPAAVLLDLDLKQPSARQ